jgi:flagellar motility protein MotE (MotC chaperone)
MRRLMSWIAPPVIAVLAVSVGLAQAEPAEKQADSAMEPKPSASSAAPSPDEAKGVFEWPLFGNLKTEIPEFREWIATRPAFTQPISPSAKTSADDPVGTEEVEGASGKSGRQRTPVGAEGSAESDDARDAQPVDDEALDWESNVANREQGLARLSEAIARQLKELEEREKKVQAIFAQAEAARLFAEQSCGGPIVSAPTAVSVIPPTVEEQAKNLELVLNMLKKMKPAQVAKLMGEWDDALVIRALKGLGGRTATPIVSKMPIDASSRIMRRIATGRASVRQGGQR